MVVNQFWGFCFVKFQSAFRLGLVLRNLCIKENVGVLGEMLSKFSKTHNFVLAIT